MSKPQADSDTVDSNAAPVSKSRDRSWGFSLLIFFLGVVFAFLVTLLLQNLGLFSSMVGILGDDGAYPPVVKLNENRVFRVVVAHYHSPAQVLKVSRAISLAIDSTVSRYTRHGSVVLTTTDAYVPPKDNLTPYVIQEVFREFHKDRINP